MSRAASRNVQYKAYNSGIRALYAEAISISAQSVIALQAAEQAAAEQAKSKEAEAKAQAEYDEEYDEEEGGMDQDDMYATITQFDEGGILLDERGMRNSSRHGRVGTRRV